MKRAISVILVFLMVFVIGTSAMAMAADSRAIAYMTIDETTSLSVKNQILAAREEIIFSHSWVADGVNGRILDKDGNVKEVLPHFSDLFPADWDIPAMESSEALQAPSVAANPFAQLTRGISLYFREQVRLTNPPYAQDTPVFYTMDTTGFPGTYAEYNIETVYTTGIYGNTTNIATYNIGYTNMNTNRSLGFAERLNNGECFAIDPPEDITLGIRASTYTNVGYWSMQVDGYQVSVYD